MTRRKIVLALVVCGYSLLAFIACSGVEVNLPMHLQAGMHPRYPSQAFFTASDSSEKDMNEATLRARAQVCNNVHSKISVTIEDEQALAGDQRRFDEYQRFVQKVRMTSECSFAELIKFVPDLSGRYGRKYYAFVALSKRELIERLLPDFREQERVFREQFEVAKQNVSSQILFTSAYREAQKAFTRAGEAGFVMRAVQGEGFKPLEDMLKMEALLLSYAATIRTNARVILTSDKNEHMPLLSAVSALIGRMGLRAQKEGTCSGGAIVQLEVDDECFSRLDMCCTFKVSSSVCDCTRSRCEPLAIGQFKGCHRSDEEEARRAAVRELERSQEAFSLLREGLGRILPLSVE
jgi:hypothetical protein